MDAHSQETQIYANFPRRKKKYRRRHRRMRDGQCAAVLRAVTAAKLYRDGHVPNLATAAANCGSCPTYICAALLLIKSENPTMLERAPCGQMPLLAAAGQMKQIAKLVDAYRAASVTDRVAFARVVGPTVLFDDTLVPAI